jgi:hypothetical protein
MAKSPAAILYDAQGNPISRVEGEALAVSDPGLPVVVHGHDGWVPDPLMNDVPRFSERDKARFLNQDGARNLLARAQVLTDEESFRDDFSEGPVALTGTATFVNGSDIVTGVGTAFAEEVYRDRYLFLEADGTLYSAEIDHVSSDTEIHLAEPYSGAGGSGTAKMCRWNYGEIGTGMSVSLVNSTLTIASGTTSGSVTHIMRIGDYGPISLNFSCLLSQRVDNQIIEIGFTSHDSGAAALFRFEGTDNKKIKLITAQNTGDEETTEYKLPYGRTTADKSIYRIDVNYDGVSAWIDGIKIAEHEIHCPGPYEELHVHIGVKNTGAVSSSTSVQLDHVAFTNYNRLSTQSSSDIEAVHTATDGSLYVTAATLPQQVVAGVIPNAIEWRGWTRASFASGGTRYRCDAGTTNDQTSGGQRSVKSTSVQDSGAGTGIQKLLVAYISSIDGTQKYEVLTLNGTTSVAFVATDVLNINGAQAISLGSSNFSVGTISFYTANDGTGTVMCQILPLRRATALGRYFVPSDLDLYCTNLDVGVKNGGWVELESTQDYSAYGGSSKVPKTEGVKYFTKGGNSAGSSEFPAPVKIMRGHVFAIYFTPDQNGDELAASASGYMRS